jgi:RND family efflux transporter MFP subunit
MRRIIPIIIVIVVLAAVGYYGYQYYESTTGANVTGLIGSGTIETDQLAITPQTSGRITVAPPEEGVAVTKGEVIFRIDATLANLQVQQAKVGLGAAQANYNDVKKDSGSTRAQIDAAKAQLNQAKVALAMTRVQVGYTTIASPIDGVLTNIAANAGENAVPGSTLAILSDPASLTVTIFIPETQIAQVKVGQTGTLTTDSTTKQYHADVVFVNSQAEFTPSSIETKDQRVNLVYQVKLRITDADSALKPGMPADVVLK